MKKELYLTSVMKSKNRTELNIKYQENYDLTIYNLICEEG